VTVVGFVVHHDRPSATELAVQAATWLEGAGHEVRVGKADAEATGLDRWAVPDESMAESLDLVVSLGGDGTMLRTVALVVEHDTPVLGVNLGRMGYLTVVEPSGFIDALGRFLAGDYQVEPRMTLAIDAGKGHPPINALNEAVIEKVAPGHTVRLDVRLNDAPFASYAADGLIVATPTGSTAYTLSARGPIVSPTHRALVVTPVAPHMLFDRALVLNPDDCVSVTIENRPAVLSVDGRVTIELAPHTTVTCTAGAHAARLVSFERRDFHRIVREKFGLAE
jgi:NAD+ kinase